ncbi:ABC transporter permease [Acholeplasma sp. OttesenSCG-928-E16]|nr:ABC transporter permease [Acholeplasma sp. OttesenSCG-928-E16]
MNEYNKINKDKFVFVQDNIEIKEEAMKTKPVGLYKDAWRRFTKNKASLISLIIVGILVLMVIIGPYMRNYTLFDRDAKTANRISNLVPRIPGLEHLGIADGTKIVDDLSKEFVERMQQSEYGRGTVIKIVSERLIGGKEYCSIKVNHYKYVDYINSIETPTGTVPTITLNEAQYNEALKKGYVISLVSENYGEYKTQVRFFEFALGQKAENVYFWFGTTGQGKDYFTVLWDAGRTSLLMAVSITVVNIIIGVILGSIAGYFGGNVDLIFERVTDILANLPFMAILTLLLLRFGTTTWIVLIAFTMTGWISSYSVTRSQFYRYKNREYVLSSRTLGASDARIMYKHIFPNASGTLITSVSLAIPSFMFTESTYSFLGIINYSNTSSIGKLLSTGQAEMQNNFHLVLFPALFISILMICFNLMSNGLRDAFNTSLRGVE